MNSLVTPEAPSPVPPPVASSVCKVPFVDSTPLLGDAEALRARAGEDGFLYFKKFLPVEELSTVRADMLQVVDRHGWRKPGQGPQGAALDLDALNLVPDEEMRDDIGVSYAAYCDIQRPESFHRLPHHPKLAEFYRCLLGGDVFTHPRHIARLISGHRVMVPTPPHQDFPLVQGTSNFWTCWIPLADTPKSLGGLMILKGSHRNGFIPVVRSKGAGHITVKLCPHETAWAEGDYEAGDFITFPSHTVHKGQRCSDKSMMRLSMDIRYQRADEVVEERSLFPHCELSWEEVYANWKETDLQYYWRRLAPEISPWNDELKIPGRRIC